MLKKNQEFIAVIEELGCNGEGVARIDGCAVFVPYALPKETVKLKILKAKNNYAFGKLMEVVKPSSFRVGVKCPVFEKCGGCNLQHLDYQKQLEWKSETVADCFRKIANINLEVPKTVESDEIFRYRNKLQLPVRHTKYGDVIGFFREGSHDVIPIDDCYIQSEWGKKIISIFKRFIEEYKVSCFDEQTGKGVLKHIVVREVSSKLLITVVITQKSLKNVDKLIDLLSSEFVDFSLFVNVNKLNNNVIFGKEFYCVFGLEKVVAEEDGILMPMGPESFMQVNDEVRKKIYQKVYELVGEGNSAVIDAYSGAGYLTARLSKRAREVFGIECIAEAVDCADKLAKDNGIANMKNVCGLCEDVLPDLVQKVSEKHDNVTVVLDPPRKGCDVAVIDALLKCKPQKIVYVSCNPSTLSRDVGLLTGSLKYIGQELKKTNETNGLYSIEFIQPYDMFPMTKHVETIVCLVHKAN